MKTPRRSVASQHHLPPQPSPTPIFGDALLRLKQQLGTEHNKEVAKALGLSPTAFAGRKKRGLFPEDKLYALAAKRPDLRLDVDYVLTGISGAAHAPGLLKRQPA